MVDIDDKKLLATKNRGPSLLLHKEEIERRACSVGLIPPCLSINSLAHTLGLRVQFIRWDKTAHGWHVVIKVREKLTLAETIAAQAILGSDPARERLNLARCLSLRKRPSKYWEARANILYSRKAENESQTTHRS